MTLESIGSENTAGCVATKAEHGNVETQPQRLRQQGNQVRQAEIADEPRDLITGTLTQTGD